MEKEDRFFIKRMGELAAMAERQNRPVFTEFLTLYEHSMVLSTSGRLATVSIQSWGGYKEAERRLICFSPISPINVSGGTSKGDNSLLEELKFPITCIHICPRNRKFSDNLSHRDFLGAVLNLGIERNRTGDILVDGEDAWLFCESEIAGFIENNLERIKHTAVICRQKDPLEVPPETFCPNVKKIKGFVSSLRLDAIISIAFHASRSSMAELIHAEKVFINGRLAAENSIIIKENDLISVRGMGKFRFAGTEGTSKKGRLSVCIERYC